LYTSCRYLLTLAASDSCYLVSVFLSKTLTTLRCWYFVKSAFDIVNRSDISCVLLQYLSDLFSNNSTCVILAFTVERAIAVFTPMRYKVPFSFSLLLTVLCLARTAYWTLDGVVLLMDYDLLILTADSSTTIPPRPEVTIERY